MDRMRGPRPLQKNKAADQKVNEPDDLEILLMMQKLRRGRPNYQSGFELFAVPVDTICRPRPDAQSVKYLGDVAIISDLLTVDCLEDVAALNTRFIRRTIRNKQARFNTLGRLDL